jgi:hypothetical protein
MSDASNAAITPAACRYIKLGAGGAWEAASLDQGRIYWGNAADAHAHAAAGDWEAARADYLAKGVLPATATGYVRELRDFYTLGSDTLWITFARDHLWWAFAEPEVVFVGPETKSAGSRYRRTIGPWRNTDVHGCPLAMHALSTSLTQLAGYRRTICSVGAADYLLRRINGIEEPAVAAAQAARDALIASVTDLIRQLHWADFELFVDLIFARAGWRRESMLGGTMKDNDLILEQPATGERASVQVKSAADQAVLDASVAAFQASPLSGRFFFVCHTARGRLTAPAGTPRPVHVWDAEALARQAVSNGLTDWLIDRAA